MHAKARTVRREIGVRPDSGRVPVRHGVGEAPDARALRGSERGREGGEAGRAAVWAGKVELGRLGRKKRKMCEGEKSGPAGLKRLGRKSKCFSFSEKRA